MRMSGFSWYVAEGTEGGKGEVDQDILDLGIGGAFSVPDSGVLVFTDPDGGGMDHTGEAIILIIGLLRILALDT